MSSLTEEQTNSIIEKLAQLYNLSDLFSKDAANHLLSQVKELAEWKNAIKGQLTRVGLPHSLDQIPTLVNTISASKNIDKLSLLSFDYMYKNAPFSSEDFYILEEVQTLRPEYLAGTWFNSQGRHFKVNMELDWITRRYHDLYHNLSRPMDIELYTSTGENFNGIISKVYIHPTATKEFRVPRDGWIDFPFSSGTNLTDFGSDSPLSFIERMIKTRESQVVVLLYGGIGGRATFEQVRNSEVTVAASRLLYKFSDPLYCARSDGKVVIKLKDMTFRATMTNKITFPSGRTLVNDRNRFPSCFR